MDSREQGDGIGGRGRSGEEEEEEEEEDGDSAANKEVKVVDWEVFHDAFVHLGGVAVNLSKIRAKKLGLSEKLQAAIEVGTVSLQRVDALEAIKRRLQEKQCHLDSAVTSLQNLSDQLVKARENVFPTAKSLLLSVKALSGAQGRLQEADKLLAGDGGQGRLNCLRKLLDGRRRELVGQLASLYPLATCTTPGSSSNSQPNPPTPSHSQPSDDGDVLPSSADELPMVIAGLQLLVPIKRQLGLFNEKNEHESSATALGYVAQVVSLVATYLDVPLRYPLRLGASRSYIQDPCPATEPTMGDTGAIAVPSATKQGVEFPLFSEGQEITRSAYAVFLLNKDLEQILNQYGVESVGPRHTLPNLSRVLKIVASGVHPLA